MNVIGSRVKFTCNPEANEENKPSISICQPNGTWSVNPKCSTGVDECNTDTDCGDPTPAYGTSSSTTFTCPTTLTISCDLGYELAGPAGITCQTDGTWSFKPTCELKDCGDPTPANGESSSNMLTYLTTLTISCDPGYGLSGPASITCQADGTWSSKSTCELKDCGDPTPANGKSSSSTFTYHTTLTISCDPGYVLSGPISITCRVDATWSSVPNCELKDCGDPSPANGKARSTTFTYQTTLAISCDPGYVLSGSASITCQADGSWSSEPYCELKECGDPTPDFGTSSSSTFTYQTTVIISCDIGYVLSGSTSITCQADGSWSSEPNCELKDCGDPSPANGKSGSTIFTYPTTLIISCDPGYVLSGPASIMCQVDGTWSSEPYCVLKECGDPTPDFGTSSSTIFTYPTTLTISCDPGYVLSGPASIICQADGTWSSEPNCKLKECRDPTPDFGTSSSTIFTYPTTLTISCDPDYVLSGPASITCQSDGSWSYEPTCDPKDCGDPTPANGKSSSSTFTYHTTLTISCDPGYVLSGPISITCQEDGIWSSEPNCELKGNSLGSTCSSATDCNDANAVCILHTCFCNFYSKYDTSVGECVQDCTQMSDTFEKHPDTRIDGYNSLGQTAFSFTTADECKHKCLDKPECAAVEHNLWLGICTFSEISLQMMKDAKLDTIRTDEGFVDMYVRQCT